MRYGGKFSTTSPAEPKKAQRRRLYMQGPWLLEEKTSL